MKILKRLVKFLVGNFFKEGGKEHYAPVLGEGPF